LHPLLLAGLPAHSETLHKSGGSRRAQRVRFPLNSRHAADENSGPSDGGFPAVE
jgi:hypothetical protein